MSFLNELRRRNVLRVGAAYVVTAWLVIQVVETIFPAFGFGDAAVRYATIAAAIGLLPALVLAWVFEWTPEGLVRDEEADHARPASLASAKRLDRVILVMLALALGYFAFDKFVLDPARDVEIAETAREEGRSEALVESYGDASIAVLAFENMSPDPDQAYFADGISEEILNLLAGISELRVISRSSAFTYKGKDVPIPQVARELNVVHVLEGSVRKAGNQIRVTAQLIDGRSDTHIWSRTWDRTLDDVFAIQDEIAADVVGELRLKLTGAMPISRRTDPEVYALTLQARQLIEGGDRTVSVLEGIRDMLEQALSIDPDHVPALLLNSYNDFDLMQAGRMSEEENMQRWKEDRARILELDPDNPVVASYDAWDLYQVERDIEAAAAAYASLLPRSLNDSEVLRVIGGFLRRIGKFEESIAVLKRCVLVDPLKNSCTWQLKEVYLWAGELEQSRIHADRLNRLWGRTAGGSDVYRMLLEGQAAEAREAARSFGDPVDETILLTLAANDLGDASNFEKHMDKLLAMDSEQDQARAGHLSSGMAGLYAYLGEPDKAFRYIEHWVAENESNAYREVMNPWFRPLHGDPRWAAHRERLGVGEARLAAIGFPLPPQLEMGPE